MNKVYNFNYEAEDKQRLDHFLVEALSTSRSQIIKLIHEGYCEVNGIIKKPSYMLSLKDQIMVSVPEVQDFELQKEEIPLDIIYEDEELIVLNKAFGMVVHPSHGHESGTLVNALLNHCKDLSVGFHEHRPGIVHRLDKDTGGLMVVAKTHSALTHLAEQFKNKTASRIYNAICFGRPKVSEGKIENYIARDPNHRKKFASTRNSKKGKLAITHFKSIFEGPLSVFELKLETGRTHQIRVHLSEYGCPIINDPIYCTSKRVNSVVDPGLKSQVKKSSEMFLFARRLSFIHPKTKDKMNFTVKLPKSFNDLLDYLNVQISDY